MTHINNSVKDFHFVTCYHVKEFEEKSSTVNELKLLTCRLFKNTVLATVSNH